MDVKEWRRRLDLIVCRGMEVEGFRDDGDDLRTREADASIRTGRKHTLSRIVSSKGNELHKDKQNIEI